MQAENNGGEFMEKFWEGRPYYSLNAWLKQKFGTKVYKLALDAGMTCPNRDGKIGKGGCIFCSAGGSGEFAVQSRNKAEIPWQIEEAKKKVSKKQSSDGLYIAYFQSFTNTYAPVWQLRTIFTEAIRCPQIAGLAAATRPDCLESEKIRLLEELNAEKPVWIELGLQTIHPGTAQFIRRGYALSCFEEAVRRLKAAGLTVVVHIILGLPGESFEQMLQTVDYLAHFSPTIDGIKLQLLHVLEGTDLARLYKKEPFPLFSMDEYVDGVITCLEHLPPEMVVHRVTGDGPKKLLIAPVWSGDKKRVLNAFHRRFRERGTWQGRLYSE